MANRTVKDAVTVKGTNPQYLVEKIIRTRIYDSKYWKEECFALTGIFQHFQLLFFNSILPKRSVDPLDKLWWNPIGRRREDGGLRVVGSCVRRIVAPCPTFYPLFT